MELFDPTYKSKVIKVEKIELWGRWMDIIDKLRKI